jgi:hypothetical protein
VLLAAVVVLAVLLLTGLAGQILDGIEAGSPLP